MNVLADSVLKAILNLLGSLEMSLITLGRLLKILMPE
jgi:hypothetical protein